MSGEHYVRPWMPSLLKAAGIYNLAWGLLAVAFPGAMLGWLSIDAGPVTQSFWQCIGMIVGVYGIGYWIAAAAPYRHWPIVLVGLLGKLFGPAGLLIAVSNGTLPAQFGWVCLFNDLIWWVPFTVILWGAIRYHHIVGYAYDTPEIDDPLRELRTGSGLLLDDLADEQPQMVVFLRHAGCTFCREAMADLSQLRSQIEAQGCGIVLVHLGTDDGSEFFAKYGLQDLPRIHDPQLRLYRQFGLDVGGFSELLGLRVILRGFVAGVWKGHGIGSLQGNSFQMPGVFLYSQGQVLGGFHHDQASDRPGYLELAKQATAARPVAVPV